MFALPCYGITRDDPEIKARKFRNIPNDNFRSLEEKFVISVTNYIQGGAMARNSLMKFRVVIPIFLKTFYKLTSSTLSLLCSSPTYITPVLKVTLITIYCKNTLSFLLHV